MRVGVLMLPTDPWPQTVARARQLEELGYASLWTYDHLSWRRYRNRPWFAAVPWLTGLAAATSTVRLGTMVASPNFRHPVTLAKDAMTLDHVSGGRITLGVGAGGPGFDATVLGSAPLRAGQRADRLAEFVEVLDALLRQPETSHRGRYYTVDGAMMLPGCVQRPRLPLAVAASGPRTLALAARYADAWITVAGPAENPALPVHRQVEQLARECASIGRNPDSIQRILLIGDPGDDARPLASVAAFTEFAGRYTELGFGEIVFHDPRPDDPVWTDDPRIVEAIAAELFGSGGRA
jgi:alkanesulfonate monooxygenase SsuD/methylene tetrahydromethanopterin reductase-like flavin-dependent oxidoreductase (luciferase family)